jgi:hypothetical protein
MNDLAAACVTLANTIQELWSSGKADGCLWSDGTKTDEHFFTLPCGDRVCIHGPLVDRWWSIALQTAWTARSKDLAALIYAANQVCTVCTAYKAGEL